MLTVATRGRSIVTHHLSSAPEWHQGPFHLLLANPWRMCGISNPRVAQGSQTGRGQWRREVMSGPVGKDNNIMAFYRRKAAASASLSNWNGEQSEWRQTELALWIGLAQPEWFTLSASCVTQMCMYRRLQHDIHCKYLCVQVCSSLSQDLMTSRRRGSAVIIIGGGGDVI